jgi:hypothetical protein
MIQVLGYCGKYEEAIEFFYLIKDFNHISVINIIDCIGYQ